MQGSNVFGEKAGVPPEEAKGLGGHFVPRRVIRGTFGHRRQQMPVNAYALKPTR